MEGWPEWDLNQWLRIPFRRSNRLSYQTMSSACTVYIYQITALTLQKHKGIKFINSLHELQIQNS